MLRYFAVVVLVVAVVLYLLWKVYKSEIDSQPKSRFSESNYVAAVRQLDALLTDPMVISSEEWKTKTRKVVETYYGK